MEHLSATISPFIKELLEGERRIRFSSWGNEYGGDNLFIITKQHIYMPVHLPRISHEIAHAVEMKNKKRWLLPDWGLPLSLSTNPAALICAVAREIRVRAIESFMDEEETINMANHPGWVWSIKSIFPYGCFRHMEDFVAWETDLRNKTIKHWSLERIKHEWKIRFDHMREYMER